ncbi:hypothetical protein N665_3659s0003 [Sinapis alba]|nr:hypothetical protein N665_3659s0003 [Sinapis alba]
MSFTSRVRVILQRNKQTFINLKGLLLGNPTLDRMVELDNEDAFKVAHAIIPQKFMDDYVNYGQGSSHSQCFDAMSIIEDQMKNMDTYNILAPVCKNATLTSEPKKDTTIMVHDPCNEYYVSAYLNNETVQKQIHVKPTNLPYVWEPCNHTLSSFWSEEDKEGILVPLLHKIMGQGVRIIVYSGDLDLAVPVTGTIQVIKNMNLTVEKSWRQWFSGGEVGGFTVEYIGNLTFATVRAACHSVAIDQPIRALTIFTSFISNTPLPSTL